VNSTVCTSSDIYYYSYFYGGTPQGLNVSLSQNNITFYADNSASPGYYTIFIEGYIFINSDVYLYATSSLRLTWLALLENSACSESTEEINIIAPASPKTQYYMITDPAAKL
jgi:hypothetical protein